MSSAEKTFVIKHAFDIDADLKENEKVYGPEENHFGFAWRLRHHHSSGILHVVTSTLECRKIDNPGDEWSLKAKVTMEYPREEPLNEPRVFEFNKNYRGFTFLFVPYAHLKEICRAQKLTIQCHVSISEICGKFEIQKLRKFDESMKEFSDVVLVIGGEKFYVSKLFLASQSTYFKALFSGNFSESQKSEIELKYLDPQDFQNLLELLHGDSFIDDDTVEGILNLADFLDAKTALKRCEEFLANRSKLPLKSKFHTAMKYRLTELKKKCISDIKKEGGDVLSILR